MDKQSNIKITQLGPDGIPDLELDKTYILIGRKNPSKSDLWNRVKIIPFPTGREHIPENEDIKRKRDIRLVMEQAKCSELEAIIMLKKHDGDIVDSIMELTECGPI